MRKLPFNWPQPAGNELEYIRQAAESGHLSGNGPFTRRCQAWIEQETSARRALLTHSCTAALEMSAILADIQPGDEVIMPSFTFVSTANAIVLRGGVPVFVDVRDDTFNLDESLIEAAITDRTRAIVVVHYAGVGCEMDAIMAIAERHRLLVLEDAAQGILSSYRGRPLGSIGHLAALSFHETKNVISGEGGALLINDRRFVERAEIIWEKGTNRSQFFRGQVDKYTWVDIGSSYLPSELIAAFLYGQLEQSWALLERRLALWERYHRGFRALERAEMLRRPVMASGTEHNGHLYYVLLPDLGTRTRLIERLAAEQINSVFHYVPLHSSPAGRRYGRSIGELPNTVMAGDRLLRLPLWAGMTDDDVDRVVGAVEDALRR
jgi:dTDP-4-amino-4,6-dideoxygalactose transaminase